MRITTIFQNKFAPSKLHVESTSPTELNIFVGHEMPTSDGE